MSGSPARPERIMVRRALVAGAIAAPVAFGTGYLAEGATGAWSAVLGVAVAVVNFVLHGLSLAWAAGISLRVLQVVAFGGFVLRMAAIVAVLVVLDRTGALSPAAFGVAAVVATLVLLAYEARLVLGGLGGSLQIPPEPPAAVAAARLRAREEVR